MAAPASVAWLWSERFWLPSNVRWTDVEREGPEGEGSGYPRSIHVLATFPLAAGIFVLRHLCQRFIAKPCAVLLNVECREPRRAPPNAILEKVFTSITKCPDSRTLEGLSKQLDWDVRKIQRWFRCRRNQDKPSTLTKFCESMWKLIYYLFMFIYGFRCLWPSPWFWDTRHCWYNYPFQTVTSDLDFYYKIQLAFYWSLMFSQFTDIKRKDFLVLFIHHLVGLVLLLFSYLSNMVRAGSLMLWLHDSSDILLEVAKLTNYAKYQRLCDAIFILFSVVFIVTRLGIYPIWILNTTLFESWEIIGPFPSWWLINGSLSVLLVIQIFWSYLIVRTVCKALKLGKVKKDERSDVESSSEEEDVTTNTRKGVLSPSSNDTNHQWPEEE